MFPLTQRRALHTTTQLLTRQKRATLKIRAPITPTVKNFDVSDDHPLWQFFHDKKYLRTYEDLDNAGRPWTIPELRRKNFDDLHSLWYSCLKERNILAREIQVLQADVDQPDQQFMAMSDSVRETMWKIRHVLSERAHAQQIAQEELPQYEETLLKDFREHFLEAPQEEELEIQQALMRFQYAIFGISEVAEDNTIDKHFIAGVKYIANLKLDRYGKDHEKYEEVKNVTDVGHAFILFYSEADKKSVHEAIGSVLELKAEGKVVDKLDEIAVVKAYIEQLL